MTPFLMLKKEVFLKNFWLLFFMISINAFGMSSPNSFKQIDSISEFREVAEGFKMPEELIRYSEEDYERQLRGAESLKVCYSYETCTGGLASPKCTTHKVCVGE